MSESFKGTWTGAIQWVDAPPEELGSNFTLDVISEGQGSFNGTYLNSIGEPLSMPEKQAFPGEGTINFQVQTEKGAVYQFTGRQKTGECFPGFRCIFGNVSQLGIASDEGEWVSMLPPPQPPPEDNGPGN
jgi:hypothetical protein